MSEFSDYTEGKILDLTLKGASWTPPTLVYISLFTTDPTDADSGAEVSDGAVWTNYARMRADTDTAGIAAGWGSVVDGVVSNAQVITFAANNGVSDVIVTHMAIHDQLTGGNMLYHTALTTSKTVQPSDVLSFDIGAITVTVA